jgi:uncharacterized BrkB/YihY/UPF0761 family membrane protein
MADDTPATTSTEPAVGTGTPPAQRSTATRGRLKARIARTRESVTGRVVTVRNRYAVVGVTFRVYQSDRRFGGGVLAESVSFRLFLTLLPAVLFGVGLLGFVDPDGAGRASDRVGLRALAAAVTEASQEAQRTRWIAVIAGFVLFAYAASKLARTIIVATSLMWRLPPPKIRWVGATLVCVGAMLANAALSVLTSWLRNGHLLIGVLATVGQTLVWLVAWWWIQTLLPHPSTVSWRRLWRGACLVGLGFGLLNVGTMLFLASKLASESLLYGAFGTAAVILVGGYYIGRLVVGSASLNAYYELPTTPDGQPQR